MIQDNWLALVIITGISLVIGVWASFTCSSIRKNHSEAWHCYFGCTWKILLLALVGLMPTLWLEQNHYLDGNTAMLLYGLMILYSAAFGRLTINSLYKLFSNYISAHTSL